VNNVSFSVEVGKRLAIIGPNGAGKTTLFNLINGQLSPTAGRILFFDQDVTDLPTHRRAHLGQARAFQLISLLQNLTVLENTLLTLHGTKPHRFKMFRQIRDFKEVFSQAVDELKKVGLWEKRDEGWKSIWGCAWNPNCCCWMNPAPGQPKKNALTSSALSRILNPISLF
jgi:branched-chain amino acid transport system ATP-binding protein